jgi:two-component system response regulator NreC
MGARLRLAPDPGGDGDAPSVNSPIRVALAEPHDLMRRGLRTLLDREDDILVVSEDPDLDGSIDSVRREEPDVLAVDLQIYEAAADGGNPPIGERIPGVGIVVVTMSDLPALARRALLTGALGFVQKQFADDELAPAVRAASRGEVSLSPPIAARLGPWR